MPARDPQEADTEGQVRINGAYGVAYTQRELHRRSHCGTHAEADRGRFGRPSPCLRHWQVHNRRDSLPL